MRCVHDARAARDLAACDRALRPIQRDHVGRALGELVTQARRAARPLDPDGTGIPECDAYLAQVARYARCDMIPDAAIDAVRASGEAMRDVWREAVNPLASPDAQRLAVSICTQARDALVQSMAALGCAP